MLSSCFLPKVLKIYVSLTKRWLLDYPLISGAWEGLRVKSGRFLILSIIDRVSSTESFTRPRFALTFAPGIILDIFQQPYLLDNIGATRTLTVAQLLPFGSAGPRANFGPS